MATLPKTDIDVYYGDAERPLPDWRAAKGNHDEDATDAEQKAVAGVLGFDPAELWADDKPTMTPARKDAGQFREGDHPRDEGGKFTDGHPGEGYGSHSETGKLPGARNPHNDKAPDHARPHLSKDEITAVAEYTNTVYEPLNKALRAGKPPDARSKKVMDHLDAAMGRAKTWVTPVAVKRGLNVEDAEQLKGLVAGFQKAKKSGKPVQLMGYQSTSSSITFGGNVQLTIRARHGLDVKPYSTIPGEDELLLPRDSHYKVLGVTKVGKQTHIELEQVV